MPNLDLEQAKRVLEERGWVVKQRRSYIKKTLDLEEGVLHAFDVRRVEVKKSRRHALEEAMRLWLAANPKP